MSAIDDLRAGVANPAERAAGHILCDIHFLDKLYSEIDGLQGNLRVARQEAESWMKGCREARAELNEAKVQADAWCDKCRKLHDDLAEARALLQGALRENEELRTGYVPQWCRPEPTIELESTRDELVTFTRSELLDLIVGVIHAVKP